MILQIRKAFDFSWSGYTGQENFCGCPIKFQAIALRKIRQDLTIKLVMDIIGWWVLTYKEEQYET